MIIIVQRNSHPWDERPDGSSAFCRPLLHLLVRQVLNPEASVLFEVALPHPLALQVTIGVLASV